MDTTRRYLCYLYGGHICGDSMECETDRPVVGPFKGKEGGEMNGIFASPYFGIGLSVIAFGIGVKLNQKFKTPFCNPLIIAIVLVSAVLLIFKIPYEDYNKGGEIINMFLAPATACLAVAGLYKTSDPETVLAADPCWVRRRFRSIYGQRVFAVQAFRIRKKPDRFFAAEICDHADSGQYCRTGGRHGADHSCGCDIYGDPWRNLCTASHPTVPCGRSGCGGPCHRGLKSRGGNFQGD